MPPEVNEALRIRQGDTCHCHGIVVTTGDQQRCMAEAACVSAAGALEKLERRGKRWVARGRRETERDDFWSACPPGIWLENMLAPAGHPAAAGREWCRQSRWAPAPPDSPPFGWASGPWPPVNYGTCQMCDGRHMHNSMPPAHTHRLQHCSLCTAALQGGQAAVPPLIPLRMSATQERHLRR